MVVFNDFLMNKWYDKEHYDESKNHNSMSDGKFVPSEWGKKFCDTQLKVMLQDYLK